MSGRSLGRDGHRRRGSDIERFRAKAWYYSCVVESGADSPGALEREFEQELGIGRRAWEKYKAGTQTPSVTWGDKPGIVERMAYRFPRTMAVYMSPLWLALNLDIRLNSTDVNELLLQLDSSVYIQFLDVSKENLEKDWDHIRGGYWDYPSSGLAMDYLAAYLLLLRELREMRWRSVAEAAQAWVHCALEVLGSCRYVGEFSGEIIDFVKDRFSLPAY